MVIACKQCHTRFRLDDTRVPAKGARVRCSRCKHAFFVQPPQSPDAGVHEAAASAAEAERVPVPEPSADLEAPPLPAPVSRESEAEPEEEEDWQFNIEEPPERGTAGASEMDASVAAISEPAAPSPDFDAAARDQFFDASVDALDTDAATASGLSAEASPALLEPDFAPEPEAAPTADAAPELAPQIDLASQPELAPLEESAPEPEVAPQAELAPEAESDFDLTPEPAGEAVPAPPSGTSELDELGSPETWDFLPANDAAPPASETAAAPAARPAAAAPAKAPVTEAAPEPARSELPRPSLAAPSRSTRAASLGAWAALAVAAVVGLLPAFSMPSEVAAARRAAPVVAGELHIEDLRARIVENLYAGPIWVVRGTLRNRGAAAARAGGPSRVRVFGAHGEALGDASLGALSDAELLRTDSPAALESALQSSSRVLSRRSLAPGAGVEVYAVLAPLPSGAVRWQVEPAL